MPTEITLDKPHADRIKTRVFRLCFVFVLLSLIALGFLVGAPAKQQGVAAARPNNERNKHSAEGYSLVSVGGHNQAASLLKLLEPKSPRAILESLQSQSGASVALFPMAGVGVQGEAGFDFFSRSLTLSILTSMPQAGSPKILFTSNRDGNAEIYSMNVDGSALARLTSNSNNDDHPRWSPDGAKILFQSNRDNPETGKYDICVMNANGTGQTRLTSDVADDSAAVWSPNGNQIVFQSLRNSQYFQVYVMNADGTNQVNVSNGIAADYQPSWSPDGSKIAFSSERDQAGKPSVYVMNANGSNQSRTTFSSEPFRDEQPVWSRDATRIAFVSTRDSVLVTWQETDDDGAILNRSSLRTNKEVYLMNADGSNQVRLTNTLENDDSPSWSPDGTQIIFRSDREREKYDPTQQLWMMSADGSNQILLASNTYGDYSPSWKGVGNQPPSVTLTSPSNNATFTAGSSVPFNATASDTDGTISKVEFLQGAVKLGEDTTAPYSFNWNSVAAGNYSLTARAMDNGGAIVTSSAANIAVTTSNNLPISDPNGPYSGLSGSPVHFNGSGSIDIDGTIVSYQWNFGDNTSGSGQAVAHAYSSIGTYSAMLTVADNLGGTATATTTVTVTSPSNQRPIANPGGPYSAVTGSPVQFNGASSYDPDGSISAYHWEFADSGTAEGPTPTHSFAASGTHVVSLKVTDNEGATNWTSLNINVVQSGSRNGVNSSPNDVSWDPGNRHSLDDPDNDRGNQPNHSEGNNNFQITAPVLSLPGRGLDLNLNLIYNSLVWNKAGNEMSYDIDQDWPAPGWQLGFGKMVAMGPAGALLIEPDGTRHSFTGVVFDDVRPFPLAAIVPTFKGRTTDGSLIEYRCEGLTGNGQPLGMARYPDGTIVVYKNYSTDFSVPHSYLYPTQIIDANGNQIAIKYLWDLREPRLERIVDSVGRVITFHYDTQKRLTRVTAPGLPDASGNSTTQTFVRLHYSTKPLGVTGAFTTSITRVRNSSPMVIDAIYYPATGTGYWLPANDAYSSYGMLKKVVEQRGMGFSGSADPNDQGTITQGTVTRQQDYDYPSAPSGLSSAPTFTNVTETWDGGTSANVTTFVVQNNAGANERTATITRPDQTKGIQKSYNFSNPSEADKFRNGLVKEEQTLDANEQLLHKITFVWEEGVDKAPRLQRLETTDERGLVVKTEYDQFGTNNSVGRVRERDYDGSIIRTTLNTFVSYVDNDIDLRIGNGRYWPRRINLVESVKVFAGDETANKLAAHRKYGYDVYAETLQAYIADPNSSNDLFVFGESRQPGGISGIVQHSGGFNPLPFSSGGAGENYITQRGNVTSITSYADTTNPSAPANPITETRTYDMTGNVIATSMACCERMSSVFELPTQYGFSVSQSRGSSDSSSLLRVTSSTSYDLKTGLPLSKTDANGRQSTITYFNESLRPKEVVSPTGARTSFDYDDVAMKVTQTTRVSSGGAIATKTTKYLNGLGQVTREEALGANNVTDTVDTIYDQFGRLFRQSRPYRTGDTPQWKETTYDAAGRISEAREPYVDQQDLNLNGSITKYLYNETARPLGASIEPGQTAKIVDPWGRFRWSRLDASGRIAEVVEPNPAGGDGFKTKYSYDTLGNLVKVEQGGDQVRRFRYDSLGRLTQQKLAEASATLNSAGERAIGEPDNERWSEVFAYDGRSNMISRTDARGVKTVFSYKDGNGNDDPLNRLQSVSYDTSRVDTSTQTVLSAATVTFQYRTRQSTSSLIDLTQVKQIAASGVSTEDYDYDVEGRLEEKRFTFNGRSQPMTVTNAYDTLGRISQVTYPEQYQGPGGPIRKVVTPTYDAASRLDSLAVNGTNYASQLNYNAASQVTSALIGSGTNQLSENYQYDLKSGLLTNQTVQRTGATLMSLAYGYRKDAPCPPGQNCPDVAYSTAYTGQVTAIYSSLKYNSYSYDALGRLQHAEQWGGKSTYSLKWTQDYAYDRYGNRTGTASSGNSGGSAVPRDGYQSLAYDLASNRITSSGFSYDPAGNQITNGTGQSLIYDAAGRLVQIKDQNGTTLTTYTYGPSNHRLITQTGDENSPVKTYYVWNGDSVICEYTDPSGATMPKWSKNYIYFGARLLATEEPNGSGGELVSYHHPDRLGTRLVTNNANSTVIEQVTLSYGTALDSESTGATNRRFTSYDRNATTGLDYAVNRHYDSRQGRFTQPDPLGMGAASLADPQSLNMYSYVGNDPMNRVDPDGQFWGALFRFIGGLFRNLKPNVINGNFAYGNRPPVSVSFTTNFQNIGVGYAGIGVPLRSGGLWLPEMVSQELKKSFGECAKEAGVGSIGFTEEAANFVSRISKAEGTATELLAYTWMKEAIPPFNLYPAPNTDTNPGDPARWDYGPFQLNAYWINRMLAKGDISADGISLGAALGGHGVRAGQPFAGDPFDNGRLAARKLNFHGTGAKAAGDFTGGTRVADRRKWYKVWAPKFMSFFDCFGK